MTLETDTILAQLAGVDPRCSTTRLFFPILGTAGSQKIKKWVNWMKPLPKSGFRPRDEKT